MKRLIFRLSSFGDVILAQSTLESPFDGETHWVVSAEYKELLAGNPKISKVWEFNRKTQGLKDWIGLCKEWSAQDYDVVLDLHASLRTRLARWIVFLMGKKPVWKTVSKERWKRLVYVVLKKACPPFLRPTHFSKKVSLIAGSEKQLRPDMLWLTEKGTTRRTEIFRYKKFVTLMPSSAWPGKEWSLEEFKKLGEKILARDWDVLILGSRKDHASLILWDHLKTKSPDKVLNGIDQFQYAELAYILSKTKVLISNDTGFAHLAEAVGTPVTAIYGPTTEYFGFGVQNERSLAVGSDLWCRPCSKDGTWCFRTKEKYLCMKQVSHQDVFQKLQGREYV